MVCIEGFIMDEPFKLFIDRITNANLFGVGVNDLASRVLWKDVLETCSAIAVIAFLTTSRIGP